MNLQQSIRKILKEETEIPVDNDKELIDDLIREYGIDTAIKYLGGIDNYINIRYDGDIKEYSKENNLKLVIISDDKMNMYINELLIKKLGIEDNKYTSGGEKKLGKFETFNYSDRCIKISDSQSAIQLADIITFSDSLTDDQLKKLYYDGISYLDKLASIEGLIPTNIFRFDTAYNVSGIVELKIDKGKAGNHVKVEGKYSIFNETINLLDEISLPTRLDGTYKSLIHVGDDNIIQKYYKSLGLRTEIHCTLSTLQ